MFVTNDPDLYEVVLTLSNHGRARGQKKQFWPEEVGFKYKMSNIQAAIGCAQLERIDELLADKQRIFAAYAERLGGYPVELNPEPEGVTNGYWMPTAVFGRETKLGFDAITHRFAEENIDARPFFHPLSSLGLFESSHPTPVAYDIAARALNLPSFAGMPEESIDRVVQVLVTAIANA